MGRFTETLAWISLFFAVLVYPIAAIFSSVMYYKHYRKPYMLHRNRAVTLLLFVLCSIYMYTVLLPFTLTLFDGGAVVLHTHAELVIDLWAAAVLLLVLLTLPLMVFDLLIKIRYAQETKKWRALLNPSHAHRKWVIRHYHKLIHAKYQLSAAGVVYIFFLAFTLLLYFSSKSIQVVYLPGLVLFVLALLFCAFCLWKIGRFADFWYIRIELWCICGMLAFFVTPMAISSFLDLNEAQFVAIVGVSLSVAFSVVSSFALLFPIWVNERREKLNLNWGADKQRLYNLIQDSNGYEALMDHAEKEFTIENLLFLTEILQFRDYLKRHKIWQDGEFEPILQSKLIVLPKKTTRSPIIRAASKRELRLSETDDTEQESMEWIDVHQAYKLLFGKYIDYGAELQVNISYAVQLSLHNRYKLVVHALQQNQDVEAMDIEEIKICNIWNDLVCAAREVTSILHDSAQRCTHRLAP